MSGPVPTFCPVFPEDFLQQARIEVRGRPRRINRSNVFSLPCCCTRCPMWDMKRPANAWACRGVKSGDGACVGLLETLR